MSVEAVAALAAMCPSSARLPSELRATLRADLDSFFAAPAVAAPDGVFAKARPCERAQALATYLCGPEPERPRHRATSSTSPACGSEAAAPLSEGKRRVLLTGCFDLMHAGHYNALRQARAAFPGEDVVLVAGVHSDEAIEKAKGAPTVLKHDERVELLKACRWVDEVADSLPYEVPVALLDRLGCDVAVHGDDLPRVATGAGLFDEVQAAGRLKIVKRTEGTSTTILIGRLMSMSNDHLMRTQDDEVLLGQKSGLISQTASEVGEEAKVASPPLWMLLPTMSRMVLFFGDRAGSLGTAKRVVYAPGEWDLFHVGHVRFLEQARQFGDYLLVGAYTDETIHRKKGRNFPLQTLHERALNILACKFVDDILLAAPWRVTADLLTTMNIAVVVTGRNNIYADGLAEGQPDPCGLGDPFIEARDLGKLEVLQTTCSLTMDVIAERIVENAMTYTRRQKGKEIAELDYNNHKTFVAES
eukprot:CAMPEP_0203869778 /NCGR_PEP_ID=MMETSP0359-20131031/17900_1 /ASSEMBLY_ACC=CAM_ASM_000338 /TAXON_ID=268821 /ORGANISM="Scrippsiella Hangoei, Strain SHTV-5" /LENGTH=473 /DNA_ID=CAMNT_0050788437 /DNA_START=18 /DNA_END=1439 /DNA_ORIENTATION=-